MYGSLLESRQRLLPVPPEMMTGATCGLTFQAGGVWYDARDCYWHRGYPRGKSVIGTRDDSSRKTPFRLVRRVNRYPREMSRSRSLRDSRPNRGPRLSSTIRLLVQRLRGVTARYGSSTSASRPSTSTLRQSMRSSAASATTSARVTTLTEIDAVSAAFPLGPGNSAPNCWDSRSAHVLPYRPPPRPRRSAYGVPIRGCRPARPGSSARSGGQRRRADSRTIPLERTLRRSARNRPTHAGDRFPTGSRR